jgi:hypothetical protein
MMIGGDDELLLAPANECIADVILRMCRLHWRGSPCVFEDANSDHTYPLSDPWVWKVGTTSREFFVYRSQADADLWEKEGAVPINVNTMFHFMIGDSMAADPRFVEVGFAFDKRTTEIRRFIEDLRSCFLSAMTQTPMPEAA